MGFNTWVDYFNQKNAFSTENSNRGRAAIAYGEAVAWTTNRRVQAQVNMRPRGLGGWRPASGVGPTPIKPRLYPRRRSRNDV